MVGVVCDYTVFIITEVRMVFLFVKSHCYHTDLWMLKMHACTSGFCEHKFLWVFVWIVGFVLITTICGFSIYHRVMFMRLIALQTSSFFPEKLQSLPYNNKPCYCVSLA